MPNRFHESRLPSGADWLCDTPPPAWGARALILVVLALAACFEVMLPLDHAAYVMYLVAVLVAGYVCTTRCVIAVALIAVVLDTALPLLIVGEYGLSAAPVVDELLHVLTIPLVAAMVLALRRREAAAGWLASIVDSSPNAIIGTTPDRVIFSWNDACEELYGYTAEEAIGRPVDILYPPDRIAQLDRICDDARAGRHLDVPDMPRVCKDGSVIYVHLKVSPILDRRGNLIGLFSSSYDVTERVEMQRRVAEQERRLKAVVDGAMDAIITIDDGSIVRTFNPAAERIFGYTPGEVIGRSLKLFEPEELHARHDQIIAELRDAPSGTAGVRFEFTAIHKDGSQRPVEVSASVMEGVCGCGDGDGVHGDRCFILVVRDISERKRIERALRDARERAERASRAKSEFLAKMSHEIRTPLNGVVGMTNLLAETKLDDDQRDFVETIGDSADVLMTVINDVLDFSKIEAGKLKLDRVRFDPARIAQETMRLLTPRATEKGLTLACEVGQGVPHRVVGDPVRLRQVLLNLVSNAIKFTDAGSVRIGVSVPPAGDDGVTLKYEVVDTGCGIPEQRRVAIFEAFEQGDVSTTRRYGGTGLGLAICSALVRMMGGTIDVDSVEGAGSTFRFTVNVESVEGNAADLPDDSDTSAAPTAAPPELPTLDVLLAEDNPINQKLGVRLLEKHGHRVAVAMNGREAVDMAATQAFDVVLMDVEMPEMDGLQACAMIRKRDAATGRHTPIVGVTAHATAEHRDRCLAAGMDAYLAKPFVPADLFRAISAAREAAPLRGNSKSEARNPKQFQDSNQQ